MVVSFNCIRSSEREEVKRKVVLAILEVVS